MVVRDVHRSEQWRAALTPSCVHLALHKSAEHASGPIQHV